MSHLNRSAIPYRTLSFLLLWVAATAAAQPAASLPDAPTPVQAATTPAGREFFVLPGHPAFGSGSPVDHRSWQARRWTPYADPGEQTPRLTAGEKLQFWLHEEVNPSSPVPELIGAGYGQLTDTPKYGSDAAGFGDRIGAAFLRDASMRFFCSSFFPAITHQDPRYFRRARGNWKARAVWAAEQAIVLVKPDGQRTFNVSDIAGHLAASVLTVTYYPAPSVTAGVVLQTWGTSIAGTAGNNLFFEFWPDVVNKVIHRRRWRQGISP